MHVFRSDFRQERKNDSRKLFEWPKSDKIENQRNAEIFLNSVPRNSLFWSFKTAKLSRVVGQRLEILYTFISKCSYAFTSFFENSKKRKYLKKKKKMMILFPTFNNFQHFLKFQNFRWHFDSHAQYECFVESQLVLHFKTVLVTTVPAQP